MAGVIVVVAVASSITAMLFVRRRAPEGSFFTDGDRASGVFGVLAGGFAIFAGFVIFLAFTTYDQSRAGAEAEALLVVQQYETAQFLAPATRDRLAGELTCYGRSVVEREWPLMEKGELGDTINPWGVALFRTIRAAETPTFAEETAFAKWLDQTSDREEARRDRVYGAAGVIPATLWIVLLLAAAIIFCFMLFFADPAEMKRSQAMLVGSATAVVTVTLLAIFALDNPYRPGLGSVKPVAMERSAPTPRRGARRARRDGTATLRRERRRAMTDRTEIVATVLLSLAAVATAWSGYQATRWNGEQTKASSRTNAIRIDAARAQGLAEAQKEVDVATFIQWIDAYAQDQTELKEFYETRFRAEFKPAFAAWLATEPLTNPDAPPTPFVMPQYRLAAEAEAEQLDADAEVSSAQVRRNIQRASNYVLGVVLFSVSLFFAGMSTKLDELRLRRFALGVGCTLFLGTVIWLATQPISISI